MNTRNSPSSRDTGRSAARRPLTRLVGAIAEALSRLGDWLQPPAGPQLRPIPVRATSRRPVQHPGDRQSW